ncbi:hypothetical protein BASA61_010462 [Batrachochytrium salamandrivorans]|nr:hypothetical protein BASA61_010462 [Batrachochytrium salamandrivorans]
MGKILNSIKRPFQKPLSGTSLHTGRAQRSTSGNEGYRAQRPVSNGIAFSEPTPTRPALPPLCNVSTQMMSSPDPLSPRPISKRKTCPTAEYQRVCKRHKPNEVVHDITTIFKQDDLSSVNFGKRFFIHSITSTSKPPLPMLSSFINERLKCRMQRIGIPDFSCNLNNSQDSPTVSSRNGTTPEDDEIESGSEAGSDSSCESIDSQDPQIVPACNWMMTGGNRIRPANVVSYNCLSAPGDSDGSSIVSSHNGIITEDDWMESESETGSSCSYESSNSQDSLTVSSCDEITSEDDEMESGSETSFFE